VEEEYRHPCGNSLLLEWWRRMTKKMSGGSK